jgi:GNAT superfamily N-acetyltransferase
MADLGKMDMMITENEIKFDFLANHNSCFISEVTRLKMNHWKHTAPARDYSEWNQQILDSCNRRKFPISFIAYNSCELIGFITVIFSKNRFSYENCYWMITLFIKEEYRRKGIAKKLLKYVEKELSKLHIRNIYLWTDDEILNDFYTNQKWHFLKKIGSNEEQISILTKTIGEN